MKYRVRVGFVASAAGLVGALLCVPTSLVSSAGASGSSSGSAAYVALGDSYAAGEGLGGHGSPYEKGTDTTKGAHRNICHRSSKDGYGSPANPHPTVLPGLAASKRAFWACSGARASDMLTKPTDQYGQPAQVNTVGGGTRAISISAGGNDIYFGALISNCIEVVINHHSKYRPGNKSCAQQIKESRAAFASLRGTLTTLYERLLDNAPGAQLAVVGYPKVFPTVYKGLPKFFGSSFCVLDHYPVPQTIDVGMPKRDAKSLQALIDDLDSLISDTVKSVASHARYGDRISFADPRPNSVPRNCRGTTPHATVAGVQLALPHGSTQHYVISSGSLHPTKEGQAVLGDTVESAFHRLAAVRPTISAGSAHTCLVQTHGSVICWGDDTFGQLGDGRTTDHSKPVRVSSFGHAVQVSAGAQFTCALTSAGLVYCWGQGTSGELGNGASANSTLPVQVSGLSNVIQIAAGTYHACALVADGAVFCWGDNSEGNLGDGTYDSSDVPVEVVDLPLAVQIDSGPYITCARVADGSGYCWGSNGGGELGAGYTQSYANSSDYPLEIYNLSGLRNLAFDCAIASRGAVYCWGFNLSGTVGDGSTDDVSYPVSASGLRNATAVAGGGGSNCAVTTHEELRCWGNNSSGKVGDGTNRDQDSPVAVEKIGHVANVTVGVDHTCAVLNSGQIKCWGADYSGQLGDGSGSDRAAPTEVAGAHR